MKTQIQVRNIVGNAPTTTAFAALDLLGLNWRADKRMLLALLPEENELAITPICLGGVKYNTVGVPSHKAIVRSDTNAVISVVTDRYTPIQNATAFDIFTTVCELAEGGHFISGGEVNGGKVTFVNGRLPHLEVKIDEDTICADVSMHNSFDAKSSFRIVFVPWTMSEGRRVTFNQEVNIAIRHSSKAEEKIQEARAMLAVVNQYFGEFALQVRELAKHQIQDEDLDAYLGDIFGKPITEDDLATERTKLTKAIFHGQKGKNLWHLYRAVMDFIDNQEGEQIEGAMFGYRKKMKDAASKIFRNLIT